MPLRLLVIFATAFKTATAMRVGDARVLKTENSLRTFWRSAVLILWAAVMMVMVARTGGLFREPPATPRPLPAEASERWHGIYGEGKKIGYSHRVRTPTADGFTVDADTRMHLSMMGVPQLVRTVLHADTDRALQLRRFTFRLRSGTIDFTVSGTVHDATLEVTSSSLGPQSLRLPMTTPVALSDTLEDFIGQERLETGRILHYTLFDPVSSAPAPVTLTVGPLERIVLSGGARSAYRVDEDYQGTRVRLWVEPNGEVIKEEGPLGLTIVRERSGAEATSGIAGGAGIDLGAAAAIPVSRAIPSPRATRRLRLRIAQAPESSTFSFPPRQRLDGTTLRIEQDDLAAIRSFVLPAELGRFAAELRATPFLQSDDPRVRETSRTILDGEHDAERAARKLLSWVHANLAKVPTISVPNARQVLEERRGDCNEHAVLYAALARAAGLPARMLAGIVYMPGDGVGPGGFYYHAWNEVWLGQWIAVDPTFEQFPADATHVVLVEGDPDKDVALIGLVGQLRLEVEEAG